MSEQTQHHLIIPPGEISTMHIECSGVTTYCRAWETCGDCGSGDADRLEVAYEEGDDTEAHGVEHWQFLGEWLTPSTDCFVKEADWIESAHDLIRENDLGEGRFPIDWESDGEWVQLSMPRPGVQS